MPSRYDDDVWALHPDEAGAQAPEHLRRFAADLDPADRALDLGCGDGRLSQALNVSDLTAADVSHVALERARRRLPRTRLVALTPDDALPFDDSSFELVLCAETIEHVRDVQLLMSEIRRVLAPGGRLALTTPAHGRMTGLAILAGGMEWRFDPRSPHLRFFSRRSLGTLLDEMGFEVVSLRRRRGSLLTVARR